MVPLIDPLICLIHDSFSDVDGGETKVAMMTGRRKEMKMKENSENNIWKSGCVILGVFFSSKKYFIVIYTKEHFWSSDKMGLSLIY